MARLLPGHAQTAAALGFLGLGALALAAWGGGVLPAEVLVVPGTTLAWTVGTVLVLGALLAVFMGFQRDAGPAPKIPAHVAFVSKHHQPEFDASTRAKVPPTAVRPSASSRAPAEMIKLDQQIRDVSREINKAGVMLATGKLSREGYTTYVEELKKQRGDLEAARIDLETRRHSA